MLQQNNLNRTNALALFLLVLSIISGYLMSKASLVGKVGMSLFYRQYRFLKIWWKGALVVLAILSALYFLQNFIQGRLLAPQRKILHTLAILIAVTGLYLTYYDFRHSLSHRLLGERFHLGAYLFWLGWLCISLHFLTAPQKGGTESGLVDGTQQAPGGEYVQER